MYRWLDDDYLKKKLMLNMGIGNGVLIPKTQSMSQETKVPTTSYKRATSSKAISLNIR